MQQVATRRHLMWIKPSKTLRCTLLVKEKSRKIQLCICFLLWYKQWKHILQNGGKNARHERHRSSVAAHSDAFHWPSADHSSPLKWSNRVILTKARTSNLDTSARTVLLSHWSSQDMTARNWQTVQLSTMSHRRGCVWLSFCLEH